MTDTHHTDSKDELDIFTEVAEITGLAPTSDKVARIVAVAIWFSIIEVRKARIDELMLLQTKFQQYHEDSSGFKHLIHEEAAEDIADRLTTLKAERNGRENV